MDLLRVHREHRHPARLFPLLLGIGFMMVLVMSALAGQWMGAISALGLACGAYCVATAIEMLRQKHDSRNLKDVVALYVYFVSIAAVSYSAAALGQITGLVIGLGAGGFFSHSATAELAQVENESRV